MKKSLPIVAICCAFALAMGLVACGGSSSEGETSSEASARAEAEAQAQAEAEAAAALEEGIGYWFGIGENGYDKEKARAAFQKAADGGNAEGWYWLGKVMETDTNADRKAQVADYYQKAADGGCAKGYCGLGYLYMTGWGVEQDFAKAQELYQKAVDGGELAGCNSLGGLYADDAEDDGVDVDAAKAVEYYEKAMASEDFVTRNAARCNLANLYRDGLEGLETDAGKAMKLYQEAADENYFIGWRGIAILYKNGIGVEQSQEKAFEYYAKEAACGSVYNLGVQYEYGRGCEVDYAKAIELFNQEIDGGRNAADAMGGMSYMATKGWGMDQDYAVAADWAQRAIDAAGPGDKQAVDYANSQLEWFANHS